jgi:NAD(P)-dependent dehydrogenase (short-subunit alcohol dehydrogenase family)
VSEERALIVTGAAGGLGAATVARLLERGARVLAVDLDAGATAEAVGAQLSGTLPADALACVAADVSDSDAVAALIEQTLERFERIDAVFNNAAILGPSSPLLEYSEEAFRRVLDVDVTGVWLLMKAALPELARRRGRIVNTASIAGVIGWPNLSGYTAAKHAVIGLTRSGALEAAEAGVTVNALCPGSMDTQMLWEGAEGLNMSAHDARELLTSAIPAGRIAGPQEVADVAVWLLLDAPGFMTGAVIPADGGQIAA